MIEDVKQLGNSGQGIWLFIPAGNAAKIVRGLRGGWQPHSGPVDGHERESLPGSDGEMAVEKPNEDLVEFHKDQVAQLHPGSTERAF